MRMADQKCICLERLDESNLIRIVSQNDARHARIAWWDLVVKVGIEIAPLHTRHPDQFHRTFMTTQSNMPAVDETNPICTEPRPEQVSIMVACDTENPQSRRQLRDKPLKRGKGRAMIHFPVDK